MIFNPHINLNRFLDLFRGDQLHIAVLVVVHLHAHQTLQVVGLVQFVRIEDQIPNGSPSAVTEGF